MSGNKRATVSISQDEYDRLREAEGQLRALPEPSFDTTRLIDNQSLDLLKSNIDEVQQRQVRFLNFLQGMDGVVQDIERSTSSRLQEIEYQAFANVENQVGNLRHELSAVINEQQKKYQEYVLSLHRQQQAEMAAYALELDQVVQDNSQRYLIANQWMENFTNLLAFIRENYAVDFFAPNSLQRFEQQIPQVANNLNNGFYDAVLLASQQAFQSLSELRLELEAKHAEWQLLYLAAWEGVNQEISQVENSFYVPAYDLDGNELSYLVDIDYWNPGSLDLLHFDLSEIGNKLLEQDNLPDSECLRQWLSSDLPGIHQQVEEIILDSRVKTINSQLRINVADLVVQALQEQGFALASSAYNNYDLRQGFGARLTNLEGSEVIVQVLPAGESVGENELQIRSLDSEERTEHELTRRWQEIDSSLRNFGVDVGSYERLDVPRRSHPIRTPGRAQRSPLKLTHKSG